ncbi:MAG: cobalt ECF transporter T component CbiQ [Candidatus Bathyarchaeota archaeon]|nr:cobalt ECF transporter T component CbiQ [Candidatus Bathyarchaeota archaeon]
MKVPQSLKDLMEGAESLVYLEDLSTKKGVLQAINPLAKLVAITAMIVASLFIFNVTYLLLICCVPIFLAVTSRLPLRQFFSRTALIPLFSVIIALPPLFLTAGNPIASANIGITTLTITSEGLNQFLIFTVRVWFCVASIVVFVLSTGFEKVLRLFSSLKVPHLIIQLFSLTYRYFFVSIHEAQSVLLAKEARTYIHKRTINRQALKDLGAIIATLFIRTYERSERVYLAMKARGFEISNETKQAAPKLHVMDVAFASSIIVAFAYLALL